MVPTIDGPQEPIKLTLIGDATVVFTAVPPKKKSSKGPDPSGLQYGGTEVRFQLPTLPVGQLPMGTQGVARAAL
jgi:hypothetical protein